MIVDPSDGPAPSLPPAALSAFSRARSLNLTKYSASVSGRMPASVRTHSRGVVGSRRFSLRSSQGVRAMANHLMNATLRPEEFSSRRLLQPGNGSARVTAQVVAYPG